MFLVWLRSPITTDDMWQKVKEKVSGLVDWKAVVTQWREKILQLTCILDHQLYSQRSVSGTEARTSSPLPTSSNTTPPSPPSPSTLNSSESFAEKGEIAIPLKTEIVVDPKLSSIAWTNESILKNWFIILQILDNPNKIMESENFTVAMTCIQEVIDYLQRTEAANFKSEKPPLDLYEVFTPWLFEACNVDKSNFFFVPSLKICNLLLGVN